MKVRLIKSGGKEKAKKDREEKRVIDKGDRDRSVGWLGGW